MHHGGGKDGTETLRGIAVAPSHWFLVGLLAAACQGRCLAEEGEAAELGFGFHGSLYYGVSNLQGPVRRNTDGVWAGVGSQEPSTLAVSWKGSRGNEGLASFGIGDMYTGPERTVKQPVECLFRVQSAEGSWTCGKHYVPFALQEWEYETRWGILYEVESGSGTLAVSTTYNEDTRAANTLARAEIRTSSRTRVGLSAAAGRGWSYSSSHAWGYGVDCSVECRHATIEGEFLEGRGRNGAFQFGFVRVRTEVGRGVAPYMAGYYCHDAGDEMGELRSGVLGVEIEASPHLVLEPGVGRSNGRNVWWLQAHLAF